MANPCSRAPVDHIVARVALGYLNDFAEVQALREATWTWYGDDEAELGQPYNFERAPPGYNDPENVGVQGSFWGRSLDDLRAMCWAQYMVEHTPYGYSVLEIKEGWLWSRATARLRVFRAARGVPALEDVVDDSRPTLHRLKILARIDAWRDFLGRPIDKTGGQS